MGKEGVLVGVCQEMLRRPQESGAELAKGMSPNPQGRDLGPGKHGHRREGLPVVWRLEGAVGCGAWGWDPGGLSWAQMREGKWGVGSSSELGCREDPSRGAWELWVGEGAV